MNPAKPSTFGKRKTSEIEILKEKLKEAKNPEKK